MSTATIRAIETLYKGYRCRSRLEARWMVYLDVLGIHWDYELEGFDLGGMYYLPDFWLPQVYMWAEVKPTEFTATELEKIKRLAVASECRGVLMLTGTPAPQSYWGWEGFCIHAKDCDFVACPADGGFEEVHWGSDPTIRRFVKPNDFVLCADYLDQHRFYSCTGARYPDVNTNFAQNAEIFRAVAAARSARFDHTDRIHP